LVWKSPRLSSTDRWIASALILLFTLYLAFSTLAVLRMLKAAFSGAF